MKVCGKICIAARRWNHYATAGAAVFCCISGVIAVEHTLNANSPAVNLVLETNPAVLENELSAMAEQKVSLNLLEKKTEQLVRAVRLQPRTVSTAALLLRASERLLTNGALEKSSKLLDEVERWDLPNLKATSPEERVMLEFQLCIAEATRSYNRKNYSVAMEKLRSAETLLSRAPESEQAVWRPALQDWLRTVAIKSKDKQ